MSAKLAQRVEGAVHVRFGSKADICAAKIHVRFAPNSDRESRHLSKVMSALPPKADMCTARGHVCFGPKADICDAAIGIATRSLRRRWQAVRPGWSIRAPLRS